MIVFAQMPFHPTPSPYNPLSNLKIQVVLEKELEIAKTHMANGDKKKALLALKKKKYQQNLLAQTEGQLFNLEQLTMTIENAAVEAEVIKGLELGNQVLKEINKEMDLDKVEKLMADTEDAIAYQNVSEEEERWMLMSWWNGCEREGENFWDYDQSKSSVSIISSSTD